MLKKTFTYKDFFGKERTEDVYFNLTRAELSEMDLSNTRNLASLVQSLKEFILKAYGEKSDDGRRFVKNNGELAKAWAETPMYDMLYVELTSNDTAAVEFIKGVVPADIAEKIDDQLKAQLAAI